jgi:hypothetical protein
LLSDNSKRAVRVSGILTCLLLLPSLINPGSAWAQLPGVNDFEVVLPQVAKGGQATCCESKIILVNPWDETVTAVLTSSAPDLIDVPTVDLAPYQSREILLAGGDLVVGSIFVSTATTTAVSASVLTTCTDSEGAVSQVSILGQPLARSFSIPVFNQTTQVDRTGIALVLRGIYFVITLHDASGEQLAEKRQCSLSDSPIHMAVHLDEIFPEIDLPGDFFGSIRVYEGYGNARSLAAAAVYVKGSSLWLGQAAALPAKSTHVLKLKTGRDGALEELAEQYGFSISNDCYNCGGTENGRSALITCLDAVARVLELHPAVDYVRILHTGPAVGPCYP